MAKRKRDVPVLFWVSAEELELIHQKMQQYGTENLSAYLRKMALDGVGKNKLYPFRPELFQHIFDRRLRIQPILCIVGADGLLNGFFAGAVRLI